jgi:hypothetical protein
MKLGARLRLFFGIIFVIALVATLTLILSASMSTSNSVKASLAAQARSVGTDYPGLVVKQNVEEGQTVEEGDVLFEIDSQALKQSLDNGAVEADNLNVTINPDNNNIELRAANSGIVDEILFSEGAYIPANSVVATIYVVDSLYVNARFQLSPPDYARIDKNEPLELLFPDNTKKNAEITSVNLEKSENEETVDTVIVAKIKDADMDDFRFSVGTPVDATLQLRQEAWFQNIVTFIRQLFTPTES